MLRDKKQVLLPLFGHAIWDDCQLEGSVAATPLKKGLLPSVAQGGPAAAPAGSASRDFGSTIFVVGG